MVGIDVSTRWDVCPQLAREFGQRGSDRQWGGERAIGDAWSSMITADALVDHIEATHHRFLWDLLPLLTSLLAEVKSAHGGRHPELAEIAQCFAEVRADLEPHMIKEERVLFPMIRDLVTSTGVPAFPCGSLRKPISVMLSEHDAIDDRLARLRQLTNGYTPPADGCESYVGCFTALAELDADIHIHTYKENNVLFPMVVEMEAERAAMLT